MRHCVLALAVLSAFSSSSLAQFKTIETIAGNGKAGAVKDRGMALNMAIANPFGVQPEADGSLIIAGYEQHVLFRLDSGYRNVTLIAGSGKKGLSGRNGDRPLTVDLNQPHELQIDGSGNIYVADTMNHRVGMVEKATGRWRNIAGTGEAGFGGDGGPANKSLINQAYSIALAGESLFIADLQNHRVREVDLQTGRIDTICGDGRREMPEDGGLAEQQSLKGPRSLAVDKDNIWIVLREGNSLWRIDRNDKRIYHVAGTGEKGFTGDGGNAKQAKFKGPKGIAVDPGRAVYVADTENHAIRRVDLKTNKVTTVVGSPTGKAGFNGDGDGLTTRLLKRPHGVCLLPSGELLIGDSENHRVRMLKR